MSEKLEIIEEILERVDGYDDLEDLCNKLGIDCFDTLLDRCKFDLERYSVKELLDFL